MGGQGRMRLLPLDDMEPFSLTVNPLSDSLSLLSLSSENLQLCGDYAPPDQQGEQPSSDSSGSNNSTVDNGSFEEPEVGGGGGGGVNGCDLTGEPAEGEEEDEDIEAVVMEEVVSAVMAELLDRVVQAAAEESAADIPTPPEAWPQTDTDSTNSSSSSSSTSAMDTPASQKLALGPFPSGAQPRTLPELVAGGTLEFLSMAATNTSSVSETPTPLASTTPMVASALPRHEEHREGITRHSSSPSIVTLPDSSCSSSGIGGGGGGGSTTGGGSSVGGSSTDLSVLLQADDPQARKRSHSSTQLSLKGKIMERLAAADKSPGTKPKVKKAKRKEEERRRQQLQQQQQQQQLLDRSRPPSIFFGDSLDLENWYSCGEGEVSEIESDMGSPSGGAGAAGGGEGGGGGSGGGASGGSRQRLTSSSCTSPPAPRFNIHPLYQHVLLYLQLYDSSRTLHALSAVAAMLRASPAAFVSAIATTGVTHTHTPQLSLLQNLLARHRVSVMGKDFYCPIPQQDAHAAHPFRGAMFLEVVLSLCLYFLRSYYAAHVPATAQDLAGNRAMQLTSVEVLTLLFGELAKVTGGSAKGFASFISDVLSKCKVQKVRSLMSGAAAFQ